ncbi:glycosyltransferase family 39 protein [Shinella daejeonensis]|uniref:glycosyltransferase family 39 protein n=1 Tax=Shinella daejeonensis TaxID=659017 RepID=UPI0020C7DE73|nr:glycosyltransferase family 39 protein [Shinella daejeonensis]MCP8894152.1 glycosyltransferase family 39 protein [Shinella daejeonensis]
MTAGTYKISATMLFILIHCLVWWVTMIAAKAPLDGYGDMLEVYAWSQHWLAGSDKHPQFLPWMAKLWFMVAPKSVASFYLLSAVNLAVALLGIAALGRALKLDERQVAVAIALSVLALPYLTLSSKLNMNAICLSTWPWAAWAFVRASESENRRRTLHAALLGVLAAITMLSKYYAVVLLLPLFASLLMPSRRWLWRTAMPWIAGLAFFLVLSPHIYWLLNHRQALAYASEQGAGGGLGETALYIGKFAIAPLLYWPIPLLISILLLVEGGIGARLARLARLPKDGNLLPFLVIGPWLTALLFSVAGLAVLSTPWAIPIGFAYTLYLVRNADTAALAKNGPRIIRAFRIVWPLLILGGVAIGMMQGVKGDLRHYKPEAEAARAAIETWQKGHDRPLRWAASGINAASLAFFAPAPIEALPALPDRLPAFYPPRSEWKTEAGVIVCSLAPAGKTDQACLDETAAWAEQNGLAAEQATIIVRRSGLRFPDPVDFELAVVYVSPE